MMRDPVLLHWKFRGISYEKKSLRKHMKLQRCCKERPAKIQLQQNNEPLRGAFWRVRGEG